jgi:hypothetical protein
MDTEQKPDYINRNPKPVSKEHLMKVLRELSEKHEADRREDQRHLSEVLRSGFYCTGGRSNIKPLL